MSLGDTDTSSAEPKGWLAAQLVRLLNNGSIANGRRGHYKRSRFDERISRLFFVKSLTVLESLENDRILLVVPLSGDL